MEKRRDNIIKVTGWSKDAVDIYEDEFFDFIYIDAAHHYEAVIEDINNWKSKVKVGGYLGGHDYLESEGYTDAVKAVNEVFNKDEVEVFEDSSCLVFYFSNFRVFEFSSFLVFDFSSFGIF